MPSLDKHAPKRPRQSPAAQRAAVLAAAIKVHAAGNHITATTLRGYGVRGANQTLDRLRDELIASGELPPEAAARRYVRVAPVKARVTHIQHKTPPYGVDQRPPMTLSQCCVAMYGRDRIRREYRRGRDDYGQR